MIRIGMQKLLSLLLAITIFLAPTNLFLILSEKPSFVNGLQIDYLIPKFYVSILFVLSFTLVYLIWQKKFIYWMQLLPQILKKIPLRLAMMLAGILIGTTFYKAPISGGWFVINWLLIGFFAITAFNFLKTNSENGPLISGALNSTIIFQGLIGIYQFVMQESLGNYLLLGEPNIAKYIGLVKVSLQGRELVLPYGTTAHPNILGGFMAVYLLSIWILFLRHKKRAILMGFLTFVATIIGMIALILTFSISSWLTLFLGIAVIVSKKTPSLPDLLNLKAALLISLGILIIAPVIMQFFIPQSIPIPIDENSIYRRNYLNNGAAQMAVNNPLVGVGLNSFTREIENFSPEREVVRFVQPVHHTGLLWLAETGVTGILFIGAIIWLIKREGGSHTLIIGLMILSPILTFDHYLLSLVPGNLLAVIFSTVMLPKI